MFGNKAVARMLQEAENYPLSTDEKEATALGTELLIFSGELICLDAGFFTLKPEPRQPDSE